jgi:hypothetical protein
MEPQLLAGNTEHQNNVVALFGGQRSHRILKDLFTITKEWIERAGVEANTIAVTQSSRPSGGYHRSTPQQLRRVDADDLTGFSLAYMAGPEIDNINLAWLAGETMRDCFVFAGRTQLFVPTAEEVISLVLQVARTYPITYGYQYVIDQSFGPIYHATGMFYQKSGQKSLDQLSPVEARRTSNWCNRREQRMPQGALRDVFPLNLLTEVHRQRVIDGAPLFNWIKQDGSRGRLEIVTPTLWAWHVPEENCVDLGDTLEAAGLFA